MNGFIRITIGAAITACGVLVLLNSANMSYQGYVRAFDGLAGAGLIGVGIAGLAFLCAGAIGVASRIGMKDVAIISAVMAVVCYAGDVYGNSLATVGEIAVERETALESQAAFDSAAQALPIIRQRITAAQEELAIVTGPDILKAQRLLKGKNLYLGKLDGIAGGKTEEAMNAFGASLVTTLGDLDNQEADAVNTTAEGRPEVPSENAETFAWVIAILLSSLSMAASAIGLPLMVGKKIDGEAELEQLEQTMDEFETEVFDFVKWMDAKEAA
ncbi:MAG: hypothetical protein ABJL57_11645 [Hyphomonas sp.]|uniref:peptidoglycan-binding domain-containing protein n=1 Tax=Hyphomonas sp. TaxID=87 RepID=UPI003262ECF4